MSSVKRLLHDVISGLPDDCTMDDFRYRLYLHRKMEASERAIEEGRVHTSEEVAEIIKSWRDSSEPNPPAT